jgi:hypothetical protein
MELCLFSVDELTAPAKDRRVCSHPDGCDRPLRARGMCEMHYRRWKKWGHLGGAERLRVSRGQTCIIEGCDRGQLARHLCGRHYDQQRYERAASIIICTVDGCDNTATRGRYVSSREKGENARCFIHYFQNVTYSASHDRVYALWGSASQYPCVKCGCTAQDWCYDGADQDQILGSKNGSALMHYSVWPEFYMPMCRKCHFRRDRALARQELNEYRLAKAALKDM